MKIAQLNKTISTVLTALVLLGPLSVSALDVSEYGVLKGKRYTQESASTPPDSEWDFYWLSAYVRMTAADSVTEATVQPPGSEPLPALFESDEPLLLQLDMPGGLTIPQMNAVLPNGAYLLALTTVHDGAKSATLSITGDVYPNTPTFLNFAALDVVDPASAFTVSWTALTGGTANDYIQVRVVDGDGNVVFRTPLAGVAGALSGTATSVVIPANTLQPESYYTIRLLFVKVTTRDTTSYPGLTGLGGYYKYTDAYLTTTAGGSGTDTTPPQLVASVPANGAANVAVSTPVVFLFNEAMADAQSITWSANLTDGNFNYVWSGDGLTLTCYYLGLLPAGTTINWTLNPSSQPLSFKDVAGNALPANTYSGSFTTAGSSTNCYGGEDDGRGAGSTSKHLTYVQTSSAAPTPHPTRAATFLSSVNSPTNNPVTAAKVQVPGGTLLTLTNFMGMGRAFSHTELYASQSALDTARPAGNYNLQLTRASGSPSADISLSGSYPNTPQIMNYDAAQAINPSADFVLQWNGFTGASGTDSVAVSLVHPMTSWSWHAPDPCVPRTLANTATSITIPAGTLQAGTTYAGTLSYSRFPYSTTNAIADMQLFSMLQKSVEFTIKTTGGSGGGGARFIGYTRLAGGLLEVKLQGTVGARFAIEASDNLLGGWITLSTQTIPAGGVATFQVTMGTKPGFLRARQL